MSANAHPNVLVVGVGNEDRGDDGLGIAAARRVHARNLPNVLVKEQSGGGTDLIDLLRMTNAGRVYIIDAMTSGASPGTIERMDVHDSPLPARLTLNSSHLFGIAQAIELARVMGWLPSRLTVYGIEGKHYEHHAPLTQEVLSAIETVVERIAQDV